MQYKEERNTIKTVKVYLSAYRNGDNGLLPFRVVYDEFIPDKTPFGWCDTTGRALHIGLDNDLIVSHEITHLVDYFNHSDWFERKIPSNTLYLLDNALKKWRKIGRTWDKMVVTPNIASDFLTLYVFDGVEIRANICAYLATGEIPQYLKLIPGVESFVLDNASRVSRSKIPEYTKEEYIRRYYSVIDFLNNPTEVAGARLMWKIKNNAVFQKYGM